MKNISELELKWKQVHFGQLHNIYSHQIQVYAEYLQTVKMLLLDIIRIRQKLKQTHIIYSIYKTAITLAFL